MTKKTFIKKFQYWMDSATEALNLGKSSCAAVYRGRCRGMLDIAYCCDIITYQEFETLECAIDALTIISRTE